MPHPTPQGETISAHETMSTDKTERAALLPCPFCGCDADTEHSDDCYFTVQEKLTAAPLADVSLVTFARVAWNRRVAALPSQPATVVQRRYCNKCGYFGPDTLHERPNGSGQCGYLSCLTHPSAPAESGWQWVPVEPAPAMLLAGLQCSQRNEAALYITELADIYLAMLKAAPSAAQPGGADGGAS
jgi:hypothetical protein